MEKEIKLPAISEGEETGLVNDVYVKEGDKVEAEQSIIAVESDKATVDVPVEEGGTVTSVRVKQGDEVKAGDLLLILETDGQEDGDTAAEDSSKAEEQETDAGDVADEKKSAKSTQAEEEVTASGQDEEQPKEEQDTSKQQQESPKEQSDQHGQKDPSADKEVPAAPLARKFARQLGIDIDKISDNPEDRVTREDVLNYARELIRSAGKGGNGKLPANEEMDLPDFSQWGETERKPMSGIRRETAKVTVRSWKSIPHVTHFDKADITALEEYRKKYSQKSGEKITVTAIMLKVIGEALSVFPEFNASIDMAEKEVVYKAYYHVGVAVDTNSGLLLPVIRDVNKKSVVELSRELSETAEKARDGKLSSDDMKGGNFVISNLGGIGGTSFTPVIFPPQTAILGISRSAVEPVYVGDAFEPKLMLPLSLSYDHRLIDGADAARFLRWVCDVLEQPINLIMK